MADRYLIKDVAVPKTGFVPERVKRQAKLAAELKLAKSAALVKRRALYSSKRRALRNRTVKYLRQYATEKRKAIALRRVARSNGNFYAEPESKLMFAIRFHGINKMAPKPKKILQLLRLRQLHNGVFMKTTAPMLRMLELVAPYLAMGYPSVETVRKLLLKRGYLRIDNQRVPLSDNEIISKKLGHMGIHGMEDIIHEIVTVGPHFKEVNSMLWPFKLHSPRGGIEAKKHSYLEVCLTNDRQVVSRLAMTWFLVIGLCVLEEHL